MILLTSMIDWNQDKSVSLTLYWQRWTMIMISLLSQRASITSLRQRPAHLVLPRPLKCHLTREHPDNGVRPCSCQMLLHPFPPRCLPGAVQPHRCRDSLLLRRCSLIPALRRSYPALNSHSVSLSLKSEQPPGLLMESVNTVDKPP